MANPGCLRARIFSFLSSITGGCLARRKRALGVKVPGIVCVCVCMSVGGYHLRGVFYFALDKFLNSRPVRAEQCLISLLLIS